MIDPTSKLGQSVALVTSNEVVVLHSICVHNEVGNIIKQEEIKDIVYAMQSISLALSKHSL